MAKAKAKKAPVLLVRVSNDGYMDGDAREDSYNASFLFPKRRGQAQEYYELVEGACGAFARYSGIDLKPDESAVYRLTLTKQRKVANR